METNKEFIPYEQALALKELGFNEGCLKYYHTDKSLRSVSEGWLNEKCVAPLYQQALKEVIEYDWIITRDEGDDKMLINFVGYHKSYEEAELECLKKLIEIVKIN